MSDPSQPSLDDKKRADQERHERNVAEIHRLIAAEMEEERRERERREKLPPRRVRQTTGPSIVYSVRLDREEVAALERQADELGIKPTAFARNLIRSGLAARRNPVLSDALDQLHQAFEELRSLVR